MRAVLATLLVHVGRAVPIDTLIEWAWPEERPIPQNPVSTFHTYATRIRRCLQRSAYPCKLHTGNGCYRLELDKSAIDHHQFRALITQARGYSREHDPEQAVEYAERALGLWRGRPLDDLSSEPAMAWRLRAVRDEWLPANLILLEALLAIGEFDQVLARLNDLQAEHAHNLGLAKLRMSALHGLSRSTEATSYYFGIRRRMLEHGDEQAANDLRQHHENLRALLERSAAAVPAPASPPRQLPHDVSDFVGRDQLLRALDAATTRPSGEPGGVVILDGMAGVGKTALAVHWGHLSRHRFPDGDFFVNLNGFSDSGAVGPSTVVDDFLIALGHPPDENLTPRSRELLLSRLLANRRTLVILDNARNTAHVKGLIALLSSCLVLVTSRQRLTTLSATSGARRVRVEPMPDPEAADLLSVRLDARHQVDRDGVLVRLCGGLPLVITVLAEHVNTSGTARLSAFAQRLDRRQLIADLGKDDDGSSIAQTFFSWSYRALDEPERRLFRLLGLHPGTDISVDVACACDGRTQEETKRSFGILVGAHLLERPEVLDRYQFHDLLREFAAYCAECDESSQARHAARQRMIGYYLATVIAAHRTVYPGLLTAPELPPEDGVTPPDFTSPAQASQWVDQERANLIAAVQHAASTGHHDQAWRLADTAATFLDRGGRYSESRTIREIAVTSAAAIGDREAEASCQAGLGMVLTTLGEHARARQFLDAALRFAESTGNHRGQASTLHQLGRLEMSRGDPALAADLYRQCLDLAKHIGDHEALCWTHCRLGQALHVLKKHNQALMHLHQCQFHAERIGDKSALAASLAEIGAIYRDRGEPDAATAYCEQALAALEALPDLDITAHVYTTLAEITLEQGDARTARAHILQALNVCNHTHNASAEARVHDMVGDVHLAMGDTPAAANAWRQAAELYDRTGNAAQSAAVRAKLSNNAGPAT